MEDNYYFCCMQVHDKLTYYKINISGAQAPKRSYVLAIHGSCYPESSISDFIEKKTKVGRSALSRSMSTPSFFKQSKPSACNVLSDNKRLASSLEMAKLYPVGTGYIPNYW